MTRELSGWATSTGLPTSHAIRSAVIVATIIGTNGARIEDVKESYWRRAGGGQQSPRDLGIGQDLLMSCGLVALNGEWLIPTIECHSLIDADEVDAAVVLCSRALDSQSAIDPGDPEVRVDLSILVPEESRRQHLIDGLAAKFDDLQRRLVGSIGEELVIAAARSELRALGRFDLARQVQQVSMHNDRAGFDVAAPRLDGSVRSMEVKSTTSFDPHVFVYVSRNEFEAGRKNRENWSLVICEIADTTKREGRVVGWCSSDFVEEQAPVDTSHCRWESLRIEVATADLIPSMPSPHL